MRSALVVLLLATPVFAGGKSLIGQEPLDISKDSRAIVTIKVSVNPNGGNGGDQGSRPLGISNDLSSHKGKPIVLFFFQDNAESAKEAKRIARLHHRYADRPKPKPGEAVATNDPEKDKLIVFGITDENWGPDEKKLHEFMKENEVSFPIQMGKKVFESYEIKSTPHRYLVGLDGKVCAEGRFPSSEAEALVQEKLDPPSTSSEKVAAVVESIGKGDLAKAAADVLKVDKDPDGKSLIEWLEKIGAARVEAAEYAFEAGDAFGARDTLAALEKWPSKFRAQKEAKALLGQLKSAGKKIYSQEKTYNDALAAAKAKDGKKAVELFRKCAKACAGSAFADRCEDQAAAVESAR